MTELFRTDNYKRQMRAFYSKLPTVKGETLLQAVKVLGEAEEAFSKSMMGSLCRFQDELAKCLNVALSPIMWLGEKIYDRFRPGIS